MESVRQLILTTPVFPFLWVPHCILSCVGLRNMLGESLSGTPSVLLCDVAMIRDILSAEFKAAIIYILLRLQNLYNSL